MIEEPKPLTVKRDLPRPSDAQIAAFQEIPTSFVADALAGRGVLALAIKPLLEGNLPFHAAGPAVTAHNSPGDLLATLAALNDVRKGDIVVATVCGHQGNAAAGDLVMAMLKNGGGAALVTDGPMRDLAGIIDVGLPVWCTGLSPASPFTSGPGTVGLPIQIGGQHVSSGDMIVADRDGVVVVPLGEIDIVLATLDTIRTAEAAYDAEIRAGRKVSQKALDALSDGRTDFL